MISARIVNPWGTAPALVLTLDLDGAEYLASVMRNEGLTSRDRGAVDIAEVVQQTIDGHRRALERDA